MLSRSKTPFERTMSSNAPTPVNPPRPLALKRILHLSALASVTALTACSTIRATIKPDEVSREGAASARLLGRVAGASTDALRAVANNSVGLLGRGSKLAKAERGEDAAACFLKVALDARMQLTGEHVLRGTEEDKALLNLHHSALARFAELWAVDPRRPQEGPHRFTVDGETFEVSSGADTDYPRLYFDRAIASESISGKGVVASTREGYGAPLVAIREQRPERAEEMKFYPQAGLFLPVTFVMGDPVPGGDAPNAVTRVTVSLKNPMSHDTVKLNGRTVPLAANFSAPFEVMLNGQSQSKASLAGFFGADERIKSSGIFLIEPYDPKRIPVIFTHGLVSVGLIWRNLVAELMADPEIAKRYQFMIFTYPSSYVISESALLFRQQLAAVREHFDPDGNDPLSTNMVAVGHSMGGMLTHLLVADIGDNGWKQVSDTPLDEMPWTAEEKAKARELTYFEADKAVGRAIFIATPHRGANKAQASISGLISRFVKLPSNILTTTAVFLSAPGQNDLKINLKDNSTSIQSLKPDSPIVKVLNASPYKKGVIYHSIIGDRGKGDTPNSSDGTVEYWSSHQEGAASELIVPTGHSAYTSPLAVEEVKRILRLHVGLR
jgi:pimeloyl-ACP methyl ester carboxylesterase